MNVVKFAHEILDMQDEIVRLNREVTRLMKIEEDYNRLLNDSLQHSQKMVGGVLALMLDDRIKINPSTAVG